MIRPDWDAFRSILIRNKVPQNQHHYYVKRIEQLVYFLQGSQHNIYDNMALKPEGINHFLQEIDGKESLSSWQFRQLLHALKLFLISLCHLSWAGGPSLEVCKIKVLARFVFTKNIG